MNIALCNLGCSKNQVDGEHIVGWLQAAGHTIVENYADAEAILVNTCAFIEEARREAINTILQLAHFRREGSCRLLAVCGCFAQRYRDEAARALPEVDHWFGVHTWRDEVSAVFGSPVQPPRRLLTTPPASQYVKIAEGCSRGCSFCAIPSIRGPLRSRRYVDIRDEVRWLEEQGARECVLVSQDTSAWGRERGESLAPLVERLLHDTRVPWLRLMYLHPADITDELLALVDTEPRVCSYLDVPLQHVSDQVLRGMRRVPRGRALRAVVERIRLRAPRSALRSSFIVGFPGEGEREFRELLAFLEWARIDRAGVFAFSPEEGTAAASLHPRPRAATAQRRCEEFMAVQREISHSICLGRVGTTVPVLLESPSEQHHGVLEGRSEWDAPEVDGVVYVHAGTHRPGTFADVRIERADEYDLHGIAVD